MPEIFERLRLNLGHLLHCKFCGSTSEIFGRLRVNFGYLRKSSGQLLKSSEKFGSLTMLYVCLLKSVNLGIGTPGEYNLGLIIIVLLSSNQYPVILLSVLQEGL